MKKCGFCGKEIPKTAPQYAVRKYCNRKCRQNFNLRNHPRRNTTTTYTGRISELKVLTDLSQKGHQIFIQLGHNEFDFVSWYKKRLFKVEVTTGYYLASGKLAFNRKDKSKFDVLAVVTTDEIIYITECKEFMS